MDSLYTNPAHVRNMLLQAMKKALHSGDYYQVMHTLSTVYFV